MGRPAQGTVNGETERERPLPQQEQFVISGIALTEGENSIRAALVADAGVGGMSAPLTITRDSTAPVIRVTRPEPGATVYSDTDTLRGRTEAGATLSVVDVASGESFDSIVEADGRFTADLTLALGSDGRAAIERLFTLAQRKGLIGAVPPIDPL